MFIVRTARSSSATAAPHVALAIFRDMRLAGRRPTLRDFVGRRVKVADLRKRIAFDKRTTRRPH